MELIVYESRENNILLYRKKGVFSIRGRRKGRTRKRSQNLQTLSLRLTNQHKLCRKKRALLRRERKRERWNALELNL